MAAELLALLAEQTLASSAALALVLLLRRPWREAFGATRLWSLWLLVPVALVAVVLPARIAASPSHVQAASLPGDAPFAAATTFPPLLAESMLLALWLAGMAAATVHFARAQRAFLRELGELRPLRGRLWLASRAGTSPAALGLLRPRIVLPADFLERCPRAERRLILAHEYCHLRRGDVHLCAFATALRIVFWFNPLAHIAAQRLRHDQELAADAAVVRAHPTARRRYATTLLNAQLAVPGLPAGCLWQSSHPMKERIMSIARPQPAIARQRLGLAASLVLAAAGGVATWAAQPARAAETPVDREATEDTEWRRSAPPRYPLPAIEQRQGGRVVLRVTVSPAGDPVQVLVKSAEPPGVFDAATIDAVKQWKFQPKIENGVAVQGEVLVPICFALKENDEFCSAW